MQRLFKVAALVMVVIISVGTMITFSSIASADSETLVYRYLAADGIIDDQGTPLCRDDAPLKCPNRATADNGHTIAITGEGELQVHPKEVSGGGTFVHKDENGNIVAEGTWEATQLLSFKTYGGSPVRPDNFRTGLAHIRVSLMVDGEQVAEAILSIGCMLPQVKLPGGLYEGVKLAVQDGLNFNKLANFPDNGPTLFIIQ